MTERATCAVILPQYASYASGLSPTCGRPCKGIRTTPNDRTHGRVKVQAVKP